MGTKPDTTTEDTIPYERMKFLQELVQNKLKDFLQTRTQVGNEWHQEFNTYGLTVNELKVVQEMCLQLADKLDTGQM
jgi:hypothetical protein